MAEKIFECRYTIIEPGPVRTRDLVTLDWVDGKWPALPSGKKPSPIGPSLWQLHQIIDPLFPAAHWEQVAVNSYNGPADMFVDEMGVHKRLPLNDLATAIYWTATQMHELAALTPSKYEVSQDHPVARQLAIDALAAAFEQMEKDDETPRIHGRAVLFDRQVWF